MELHELVWHEWHDDRRLSRRSLIWIRDHADPGDPNPVVTAIAQLRQRELELGIHDHDHYQTWRAIAGKCL